ncbi:hypothetical protein A6V39_02390 [Candidatus Mycoplasma haematobovis]|uniref:Uncharacterized protein n=1 Tax=Candidatus Mycoplasma haematobovis TaxID=432608 RepID=A0A1A9QF03_9MOLU|nr:hypothetical protein [Candidatus Mycoplasma haematobovis]OAL10270.1 hypothetical protein A6V39_02390 [Candidatus Mycoplasma haematobovis]
MISLKRELEKSFFKKKFSEIKKHPLLKDLELEDEEIIKGRVEINKVLENYNKCGESKRLCFSLEPHFTLKKNVDGKLIIKEYKCTKSKNYQNITSESINKEINKLVTSTFITFNNEDVKKSIENLSDSEIIKSLVENIGNCNYPIENMCISTDNLESKKDFVLIYAYHLVLSGEKVTILKSSELKEICIRYSYNFDKKEEDIEKYEELINVKNLIIIDFGLENELQKIYYYLDLFPDFLSSRSEKNKKTHIITSIKWDLIRSYIRTNYKNEISKEINKQKLSALENTMQMFFSRFT